MMIFIIEAPGILFSIPIVIIFIPTIKIGNSEIAFIMRNFIYRLKTNFRILRKFYINHCLFCNRLTKFQFHISTIITAIIANTWHNLCFTIIIKIIHPYITRINMLTTNKYFYITGNHFFLRINFKCFCSYRQARRMLNCRTTRHSATFVYNKLIRINCSMRCVINILHTIATNFFNLTSFSIKIVMRPFTM